MKCPKCDVELDLGKAIDYDDRGNVCTGFGGSIYLKGNQVKLVDVLKCPKCGHSEDFE